MGLEASILRAGDEPALGLGLETVTGNHKDSVPVAEGDVAIISGDDSNVVVKTTYNGRRPVISIDVYYV